MVLTCAGMSSGPSVSWLHPACSGASRSSAAVKSSSTEGSAFSCIVSDAEVWRMNSISAPSLAPASFTNFAISAAESIKPPPAGVCREHAPPRPLEERHHAIHVAVARQRNFDLALALGHLWLRLLQGVRLRQRLVDLAADGRLA